MSPDARRLKEVTGREEADCERLAREMERASPIPLDAIPAYELANLANRLERHEHRPPDRLPDRADALLELLDMLARDCTPGRHVSLEHHAEAAASRVAELAGLETVLTRGGRALVPRVTAEGRTAYSATKFRDLDMEEYKHTETRVIEAIAVAIAGRELSIHQRADLVNFVIQNADSTEREAWLVVRCFSDLEGCEPPANLVEVMRIVDGVLKGLRRQPEYEGPGLDDEAPIDRSPEAQSARLGNLRPEMVRSIENALEAGVIEPRSALAGLGSVEAGIVIQLALTGLKATRASEAGQSR